MSDLQKVAVVGNPNSGKTTLFNGLTGSKQRIGNWPGVTVERKEGTVVLGESSVTLVDLPGIYSLSAHSEDERVARDYILSGEPAMVINIVDATNLERNLYLTTQLLEMRVPILLVVNMLDLASQKGISIDLARLEKRLGSLVMGIIATQKEDIQRVRLVVAELLPKVKPPPARVGYPPVVEAALKRWHPRLEKVAASLGAEARWVGLKLLEQDPWVTAQVVSSGAV